MASAEDILKEIQENGGWPKPKSPKVIEEIKKFVCASPDIRDFGKKAVLHLIDQTKCLSRTVTLVFPPPEGLVGQAIWEKNEFGRQAVFGVHDMCSSGYSTRLGEFLDGKKVIGTFESGGTTIPFFGSVYYIVFRATGYLVIEQNIFNYFGLTIRVPPEEIEKIQLLS
jgi:hypothetical protein